MVGYSNHSHGVEHNDCIKHLEYPVESRFELKRVKFSSVITIYPSITGANTSDCRNDLILSLIISHESQQNSGTETRRM